MLPTLTPQSTTHLPQHPGRLVALGALGLATVVVAVLALLHLTGLT